MMSKKSPQLRFEGFTDDWEEHKLGDYIIQYSEKTKQNNQYPVFTSSRNGLFFQKDYYKGNQIASEDNTGYNIVPRGYFTYRHMSDDLVFKFNINDLADYGIVSTLYPVFTTNEQLDSKYLQYQLNEGSEFRRFSLLQKQGGSRTYMYLNKLQNMILTIPKLEEQQKIGSFFQQLDETIALHQRKLDLLKEQKKGYLQKMFPKNGSKIPELRFAGFADDWEQRKLGEMLEDKTILEQSDGNHGELYPKSSEFAKEGIPYLAASNIIDNNIDYQNVKYLPLLRAEQFKKGVARDGDILLAHNATVGPSALLKINLPFVILSTTLTLYRINKDKMDNLFFLSIIRSNKVQNQLKKMMKQTTRNQVPILAQRTIDIFYPKNLKEQAKVGEFFQTTRRYYRSSST